jgi:hypothetical protein
MTFLSAVIFVALNFIPAFLENISTCSWLATCMLLKDMNQENELKALDVIGFEKKRFVRILMFSGLSISLLVLGVKEWSGDILASRVERFRREKIKNINVNEIKNKWILADENSKIHFDFLNLTKNEGTGLTILKDDEVISVGKFVVDLEGNNFLAEQAERFRLSKNEKLELRDLKLHLPAAFVELCINERGIGVIESAGILGSKESTFSEPFFSKVFCDLLNRLLSVLLIPIYLVLTALIFFLFSFASCRWAMIFLPYPVIKFLFMISSAFLTDFCGNFSVIIPYAILFAIAALIFPFIK